MFKKTILIDLDGVLNTYTGSFNPEFIPPIRAGVKEFLATLSQNYELKLFTTRSSELAMQWLEEYQLTSFFTEVTNIKKPAWLLVDDRCVTFDGNYDNLTEQITLFKPWYKSIPR